MDAPSLGVGRPGDCDARIEQAFESGKECVLQIDPEGQDALILDPPYRRINRGESHLFARTIGACK